MTVIQSRLAQLAADIRTEKIGRAALFWLRIVLRNAKDGALRSDRWVEMGLESASSYPGLVATDPTPRLALMTNYDLLQAARMRDQKLFRGDEVATLDWNRKYLISPTFDSPPADPNEAMAELAQSVEELWDELGAASPKEIALETLLQERRGEGPSILLEVLHEAQAIYDGWLPRSVLTQIAQALDLPVANVYGVTEFYTMFYTKPVGAKILRICEDAPCQMAGGHQVMEAVCQHLNLAPGEVSEDGAYMVEPVRCLGLCDHAPAALVNLNRVPNLSVDKIDTLLADEPDEPLTALPPKVGGLIKVALANAGLVDPTSLDDYQAQGGLAGLKKVLSEFSSQQVIDLISESKLVGRGGAAFPTGLKWKLTADNPPGPRYVICNADESEPGAFKDRVLLDTNPFGMLEGLLIACYAVGAKKGYVYVRGENAVGYLNLKQAIAQLTAAGWLGDDIQGSAFSCQLELRRGAGAYICGEESALMESIEGKRGFPRLRPPFPTTVGLFGAPTVINNVETLAKVPSIVLHGSEWYKRLALVEDSAGTKLFSVSGSVNRPGVYEVPFGVTLRHLIEDLAGGIPAGRQLRAILTGGAAGTFVTAEQLDAPLSFEQFRQAGGTIGAGTIMVFDNQADMRQILSSIADFFAHEGCGKCYPCQMGTQRQKEIMARVASGQVATSDAETLLELSQVMTDTSICGLGQTAGMAVLDAHKHWPELLGT